LTAIVLVAGIYSEYSNTITLTDSNFVNVRDVINKDSVDQAIKDIKRLEDKKVDKIYLVIDSPGGEVLHGFRLIKFIEKYDNIETITIRAASMASALVEAVKGKRYVVTNGLFMFHRSFGAQKESDLLPLEIINSERIGISLTEYRDRALTDWWIRTGKGAVEQNVADKVVQLKCDASLLNKHEDSMVTLGAIFGMVIKTKVRLAKCPLMVNPIFMHRG
jgi:hypothetical protein